MRCVPSIGKQESVFFTSIKLHLRPHSNITHCTRGAHAYLRQMRQPE